MLSGDCTSARSSSETDHMREPRGPTLPEHRVRLRNWRMAFHVQRTQQVKAGSSRMLSGDCTSVGSSAERLRG
jgi:hypothetical protein